MTRNELYEQIQRKKSFLCVGLDTDVKKISGTQFDFNKRIIDATAEFAVCYKPNLAFYEEGGWDDFWRTCDYIRKQYPEIFIIADAKRGDIGNTSEMYARAFFGDGLVDAVTLSPYMGRDTVEPFLKYEGKWAVILALTSNASAADFETLELAGGKRLYEQVLETSKTWGTPDNTMYVVGATQASELANIRKIVPDHFLLVPGVGAQGGSLQEVAKYGLNDKCGLLVNSSRGIIYAPDPAAAAREMQQEMAALLAEMEN
jgi:orotidine-5'-phosphate decarboxylase